MSSIIDFLNRIFGICNLRGGGSFHNPLYLKRIALLILAFFSAAFWTTPAAAAFSIEYQAPADPTNQGFSEQVWYPPRPQVIGPIANDLGYPAWSISGLGLSSQFFYLSGALKDTRKAEINSQGFTLTLRGRALRGNAPAYDAGSNTIIGCAILDIGTRYDLCLGINSSGNTVAVLNTSLDRGPEGNVRGFGPSYTLNDAGYHTYDLVFSPITQSASLFIDGVERISGYTGHSQFLSDGGLIFGAMSGGGMNFNLVRLTSPAVVPVACNELIGETLQTCSSYEFSLEQGMQKTDSIQLINLSTVARTAMLEVINPHSDLGVSLTEPRSISIAPGETKTLPIDLNASATPVGVYDDLLLKVTVDDGSTLYASIKVNVLPSGTGQLPDLTIIADDVGSVTNADGTVTLTAAVRNRGLSPAANVQVQFYEFGNPLGQPVIAQIAPSGIGSASVTVPAMTTGDHLIRVMVDPAGAIAELDKTNNEASRLIPIGSSGPTEGNILVTGSLPVTVYTNALFTLSGSAVYDLYINGVRNIDYVVKGGSVQITVGNAVYGDIHTDVNGNFVKTLQAPATPGTYHLTMTVTDKTFLGTRDLTFKVEVPPPTPPSPPLPPTISGVGYWTYDAPTGAWTWTWTTPPPSNEPTPERDLRVFSEKIYFSKNNPAWDEEITLFAEIQYWATSTSFVSDVATVNVYVTDPATNDKMKVGQTTINSLSVGSPDFGSRYVYATWKNRAAGIYLVEFEIVPTYSEYAGNNAATRAIIVGPITSQQGAISGQVTTPLGGVGGVMIHVFDAGGARQIGNAVTDATGFYLVKNVPLVEAQVSIDQVPSGYLPDAATKTVQVSNQEISTVDFRLTKQAISDTTPPVLKLPTDITAEATGPSGAAVTYTVSATDDVDGAVTPTCTFNSGDTFPRGATTVTCSATDQAGNTTSGSFKVTVQDTTPPAITVPGNLTREAISPSGATVTFTATATDLVSGEITPTCTPASGSTFGLGATPVTCSATDGTGNTASGNFTVTVQDTTPPTITGSASPEANTNGWRNTPVTVSFTCTDTGSGIAACAEAQTLGSEGANQSVSGTATDNAGNSATTSVTGINIDRTPPAVSVTGVTDGAVYTGSAPPAGCATTDVLSGVQTNAQSTVTSGNSNGTFIATCAGATDNAGNASVPVSVNYQVIGSAGPINTGALTIGFWRNKNGQALITGGASSGGVCNSGTWLRQYAPYQDLSTTATCSQVATYVTNRINAATASGSAMNAMLKAQMLANSLSVYFSDPALGGNRIAAPAPIGGVSIDLTRICNMIDASSGTATCSGVYQDVGGAFGGAANLTVSQMLAFAASQSNAGGSLWYGNVKATQELAKNAFDAINNRVAFAP